MNNKLLTDRLISRFWSHVDKSAGAGGCWPWTMGTDKGGYGRLWVNGHHVYAHRFSWQLAHGDIPEGMRILHKCDFPPCCNPAHLFIGTLNDNNQDMIQKGREKYIRGEQKPNAKLTDDLVISLRNIFDNGSELLLYPTRRIAIFELAQIIEVNPQTLIKAISRKKWKHI